MDPFFDVLSSHNRVRRDPTLLRDDWQGLVIAEELWEAAGRPAAYEPFRPGCLWQPYQGESFW